MNKIVLYAALALAAAVAVRASSEDIDGCQETLIACLNDSGAFFTVPASSEDPTDVTCGCQSASTTGNAEDNVNDGGCSCFCSCFNQYYTCYYTNVANSMIDAMKSAEDIITIGDTEYNISDYSPTDCIPTNSGSSSGEGTKGSGDNSGGHEDSDYNGDWCFFQYYGDPHLVSTTDGKNFDWWSCMMKNFTSIYQSSKLKVTGVGSALNGPKYLTYGTEITIEMKSGNSVTKTTVKASSMTFSNKTAPKGYVLGSCNRTVKNTPLTLLQSNKCVAMYSNTGEFMAIIQDGSSWTGGNFLMVEFYGPCDGQGNVQEGEGSCPSSRRVVRKVARSSPLCKGISAPYSEICNYDVSESGIDETSTSSYFASNGAKMAASYFHAINTLTGGVAAAAGLSAGAIAGIAIGATAGGLAVVGAATVVAVKVISGSKKEEPVETTERKKPTFAGAGPNVMDPDPLNHTSITARAPPVAV